MGGQGPRDGEALTREVSRHVEGAFRMRKSVFAEVGKRWPNLQLLSFTFLLAWVYLAFYGNPWIDWSLASERAPLLIFVVPNSVSVAAFLLCFLFQKHVCAMLYRRWTIPLAGCIAALGDLLMVLSTQGAGSEQLLIAGCLAAGAGTSLLTLRLAYLLSEQGARRTLLFVAVSSSLALLVWFLGIGVPFGYSVVLFVAVPLLLSALLLTGSGSSLRKYCQKLQNDPPEAVPHDFWRFSIVFCLFALITGITKTMFSESTGFDYPQITLFWALIGCMVLTCVAALGLSYRLVERMYYLLTFCVVIAVLVSLVIGADSPLLFIPVNMLYIVFDIISWCLIAAAAYQHRGIRMKIMAFGRFSFIGGTVLGYTIGYSFLPSLYDNGIFLICIIVAVMLLVAGITLVFSNRSLANLVESAVNDSPEAYEHEGIDFEKARQEHLRNLCERMAAEYSLSNRELTVLIMLARGRSNRDIRDELLISINTVRAHVQSIYGKLGVHSRSELAAFLENS